MSILVRRFTCEELMYEVERLKIKRENYLSEVQYNHQYLNETMHY